MNKFGNICLIGQPNVGKSTLTNHFLSTPIAIESHRPQTTWYAVKGIFKSGPHHILLTDTPGIHDQIHRKQNQKMNRIAYSAISQSDIVCHMVTPQGWTDKDQYIYEFIRQIPKRKILLINKIDQHNINSLLPFVNKMQQIEGYDCTLSISAKDHTNCDILLEEWLQHLPSQQQLLNPEVHDHTTAFLTQEMVREQLMQQLLAEMPYTTFIEVFHSKEENKCLQIYVNLHVKHIGQKKMIIGDNGQQIKKIGQKARKRLQVILKKRIMLKLWVKVNPKAAESTYIEY